MANGQLPGNLLDRVQRYAAEWRLRVEESFETETSVISYVSRDDENFVLKVVKREGDEWHSGAVLRAFEGQGVVHVYEHTAGAMLLERLQPGTSLSLVDDDEQATEILAGVIEKMTPSEALELCPSVEDWGQGFDRYLQSGDSRIPKSLVESAREKFSDLCASQPRRRLLHGDLQHYNVLFDAGRGWLAIDPKGVIGEPEYEIGAALRNPFERPEVFLSPKVIANRLEQLTTRLSLNYERSVAWSFAQAVLSVIWMVEDGHEVSPVSPVLQLAEILDRLGFSL